jgi:hypothetical protein
LVFQIITTLIQDDARHKLEVSSGTIKCPTLRS